MSTMKAFLLALTTLVLCYNGAAGSAERGRTRVRGLEWANMDDNTAAAAVASRGRRLGLQQHDNVFEKRARNNMNMMGMTGMMNMMGGMMKMMMMGGTNDMRAPPAPSAAPSFLREIECSANITTFETDVDVDFAGEMPTLSEQSQLEATFGPTYNDLAENYCDEQIRTVENATITNITVVEERDRRQLAPGKFRARFRVNVSRRGSGEGRLFNQGVRRLLDEAATFGDEQGTTYNDNILLTNERALQETDVCFCDSNDIADRAPTAEEFTVVYNEAVVDLNLPNVNGVTETVEVPIESEVTVAPASSPSESPTTSSCVTSSNLTECCLQLDCPTPDSQACSATTECVDNACALACPDDTMCVFGSCSARFSITWNTTNFGLIGNGGWQITNDGLTIRYSIEDSANCNGSNFNTQEGTAEAMIFVPQSYNLTAIIDGISELQSTSFENMLVYLDGTLIVSATSPGGDLECAMGPSVITFLVPQPLVLSPGTHIFLIEFDTADEFYHVGAYYELNLIFVAV